ncbi:MAG: 16S rRNA (guanine(966)-N(2))-methyltransferase RsmD [Ruminococcus sp.]|nr:16S rRNA (guanine(966)-N(2))-methyltransferase RsmD [Candidatus Copronaster equi]
MRVITGTARGRVLKTLEGEDVRPTTDRVKEAIFSIIQFEIEGRQVLDLFAGSGQLGIEALSRGAAYATFVDMSKDSVEVVKSNLLMTKLHKNSAVLQTEAVTFIKNNKDKRFDIVFMDPPYSKDILQNTLPFVAEIVNDGGVILCEHPYGEKLPEKAGKFSIYREYKYGKIGVTVYRNSEEVEE